MFSSFVENMIFSDKDIKTQRAKTVLKLPIPHFFTMELYVCCKISFPPLFQKAPRSLENNTAAHLGDGK